MPALQIRLDSGEVPLKHVLVLSRPGSTVPMGDFTRAALARGGWLIRPSRITALRYDIQKPRMSNKKLRNEKHLKPRTVVVERVGGRLHEQCAG